MTGYRLSLDGVHKSYIPLWTVYRTKQVAVRYDFA